MATPVQVQMTTHLLRSGGSFNGSELVTVMAGANDVFMNLNAVAAAAQGGDAAVGAAWTADAECARQCGATLRGP